MIELSLGEPGAIGRVYRERSAARDVELELEAARTCSEDLSQPLDYVCTVQHSDFKWIPAGTDIRYLSQAGIVAQASIEISNGSTGGACTWSSDVDAVCAFGAGTGG
jgi:hypothetical protein